MFKRGAVIAITATLLIIAALLIASHEILRDPECDAMYFRVLEGSSVTSIRLHDHLQDSAEKNPIHTIVDEAVIDETTAYILDRIDGWHAPVFGVPFGDLRVVFWSVDDRIAAFTIGPGILESQGCGYFFIREISTTDLNAFLEITGVSFNFE